MNNHVVFGFFLNEEIECLSLNLLAINRDDEFCIAVGGLASMDCGK